MKSCPADRRVVLEEQGDGSDQRKRVVHQGDSRTFSEAEFKADGAKVVAYAAATGMAVVAASDGRPVLVISIPTEDLPVLDR